MSKMLLIIDASLNHWHCFRSLKLFSVIDIVLHYWNYTWLSKLLSIADINLNYWDCFGWLILLTIVDNTPNHWHYFRSMTLLSITGTTLNRWRCSQSLTLFLIIEVAHNHWCSSCYPWLREAIINYWTYILWIIDTAPSHWSWNLEVRGFITAGASDAKLSKSQYATHPSIWDVDE